MTWYIVNWSVGDGSWKETKERSKKNTGISHYKLYDILSKRL